VCVDPWLAILNDIFTQQNADSILPIYNKIDLSKLSGVGETKPSIISSKGDNSPLNSTCGSIETPGHFTFL
jgi:hypothetical protein